VYVPPGTALELASDTTPIVVEIRRGKYDSPSWIGTQHTHILCNRFKKKIACF
jgi:hypothetical protein